MGNSRWSKFTFGRFALDVRAGELLKNGRKVILQEQPFRVLALLVEHAGEVVTREELRRCLWPNDTVVEFDHSINAAIRKLRIALGDSAEKPRYFETMGRRGYRFIARLECTGERCDSGPNSESVAAPMPPVPADTNLIGRRVSHYRVLELAGGGGMGVVYKAEDIRLGRRVALKFLPGELSGDALAIERFEREARAASALDHRNICPVYEFGEHEGQPFIVMPFLAGATLRHRLDAGDPAHARLDHNELLDIAVQIAEGLDAAHRNGIIHRDIKPANVFVTLDGEAKILDFGVAKLVEAADRRPGQNGALALSPASLTRTGATMGTASYMSPEQVRGERLDTRTDLYSFGLVLYEMATHQQAFAGETIDELREAILSRPLAEPRTTVPGDLWKMITRATQKDRELRYQTAPEMRAELGRLQRKTAPMPKERFRRWLAFYGAVLLAVMAIGLQFAYRRPVSHPALIQRKLTNSSVDNRVLAGIAISPDGRFLAYSETSGMRVKVIETGETRPVPHPQGIASGQEPVWSVGPWFPDGRGFIANARPPGQDPYLWTADRTSIWTVPTAASPPYMLRDHAEAFAISPDGQLIAFGANPGKFGNREIWIMDAAGGGARKLYETGESSCISGLQWSPDAQRVIYVKTDATSDTVISRALKGGPDRALLSFPLSRLHDYLWLADWRLLYVLSEPGPVDDSCNIWHTRIDPANGLLAEAPEQATTWAGFCLDSLSATADAKHLVFHRWAGQTNVSVASFENNGTRLGPLKRLTLNDNYNNPLDWTADGRAVILASNRNGSWGLFQHSRDSDAIASLVTGADLPLSARISPDGAWILYAASGKTATSTPASNRVMRLSTTKGAPEVVMEAPIAGLSCPNSGDSCAIAERTPDRRALVFTALHPVKGRRQELARFATDPSGRYDWNLSPDGARIAVLKQLENEIHILSVAGRATKTVEVKGLPGLQNVNWRADGTGLLSSTQVRENAVLLAVDLDGNWRVLWQQPGGFRTYGVPSRDGRYLAIMDWRIATNIWMLENF